MLHLQVLCGVGRKKAQQGFEQEGVELQDLQKSRPTSATLQFCDCNFFADFSKFSVEGLCLGFPTVAQSSIKQTRNSRVLLLFPCQRKYGLNPRDLWCGLQCHPSAKLGWSRTTQGGKSVSPGSGGRNLTHSYAVDAERPVRGTLTCSFQSQGGFLCFMWPFVSSVPAASALW